MFRAREEVMRFALRQMVPIVCFETAAAAAASSARRRSRRRRRFSRAHCCCLALSRSPCAKLACLESKQASSLEL